MLDLMGESTRKQRPGPEARKELTIGNFFNPTSPSFLGGNNPVASIGKAALSVFQPELAPYIYGASAIGDAIQGNWIGAAGNAIGTYGAGGGFTDPAAGGGFSFDNGANGTFEDLNKGAKSLWGSLSNGASNAQDWASNLWNGTSGGGMTSTGLQPPPTVTGGAPDTLGGVVSAQGGLTPTSQVGFNPLGGSPQSGLLPTSTSVGGFGPAGSYASGSPVTAAGISAGGGSPFTGARALNTLSSIGSGVYGLYNANNMRNMASQTRNISAPWGGAVDSQLQNLLTNPSTAAANDPAFQLRMQAAMRANAPAGTDSGAMAVAAANASTDWYNGRLQQLGGLYSQEPNPLQAQYIALQGTGMANTLAGQSLASIGFGLNNATGGGASSNMPASVQQWLRSQGINI